MPKLCSAIWTLRRTRVARARWVHSVLDSLLRIVVRAHKLTFISLSPQPADKIPSSGYSAPELQRWKIWHDLPLNQRRGKLEVQVSELLDVWGFGVVLFQLCTGEVLFEQNVADDEIVRPLDEMRK